MGEIFLSLFLHFISFVYLCGTMETKCKRNVSMCKTFSIKVMACEGNHLKEELVGCISDLFLKYGLRSTSMDDMANHLKVSKKTLYQIFENKEDVVEQVMYYRLENLRKETSPEELQKIGPVRFCMKSKGILSII